MTRFHLYQPRSAEGTCIVVETTNDEQATIVALALIKGGFFLYDEAVELLAWQEPGGWVMLGSSMICSRPKL